MLGQGMLCKGDFTVFFIEMVNAEVVPTEELFYPKLHIEV
jgi:hypothetical protein